MADNDAISTAKLHDGMIAAAKVFSLHHIGYALIGGMAVTYWTQPRFTKDMDFLLVVPQIKLPSLLDSMKEQGFEFDLHNAIGQWNQHHVAVLDFHGARVDWLKPVIPTYQHILDRAPEVQWLGHKIRVATPEGLVLLKLMAYRSQDIVDIENLVASFGDKLDLDWIRTEWQSVANLDDPRMVRFMELIDARKSS